MLWKRFLEEIAQKLAEMPPSPWRLSTNASNQRVVLDANDNTILIFDAVVGDISLEQWRFIEMFVQLRNNCETWFDEMKMAGMSDIVLPKKPKRPPSNFVPVPAIPTTFHLSEILGEKYDNRKTND